MMKIARSNFYWCISAGSLVLLKEKLRDQLLVNNVLAAPPTDLPALAGLLRKLDLLVTNDTGPMHLSVAVGTPTVAIFVAGEASRWGHPYSYVRNLTLTGRDEKEADRAALACEEILSH